MYLKQAIKELSLFIDNPYVASLIEKLEEFSKNPRLLTLPEINQLIQKIRPFESQRSIVKKGRSLAEVGLRVICMLTILKPVTPEEDFRFSTKSAYHKAQEYLEKTKRNSNGSLSLFADIPDSTVEMDFDSLATKPFF